VTFHSL